MSEMEVNKLFMLSAAYTKGHESLWVHFSEIHIVICHLLTAYMHVHVVYSVMILGFLLISHCREPSTDHDHRYHRKFDWCQEGQLHVDAMGNTIGHAVICGIHGWRLLLLQIQVSKLCISRFCPCQNRYKYLVNIVLWIIIMRYQFVFTIILQDDQFSTTSTFFTIM